MNQISSPIILNCSDIDKNHFNFMSSTFVALFLILISFLAFKNNKKKVAPIFLLLGIISIIYLIILSNQVKYQNHQDTDSSSGLGPLLWVILCLYWFFAGGYYFLKQVSEEKIKNNELLKGINNTQEQENTDHKEKSQVSNEKQTLIDQLTELRQKGILTEEEFAIKKDALSGKYPQIRTEQEKHVIIKSKILTDKHKEETEILPPINLITSTIPQEQTLHLKKSSSEESNKITTSSAKRKRLLYAMVAVFIITAGIVSWVFTKTGKSSDGSSSYNGTNGKLVFKNDCFVIITGSFGYETDAINEVKRIKNQGYSNAGYLWIPDYPSLSGKQFYAPYIGPFASYSDCENNLRTLAKTGRFWYGIKVSYQKERVEIR